MINQTDAHKRGSSSKRKGSRGENELMHILRDTYGYPVRRGYVFYHESDLVGLEGIHVECKRVEKLNLKKAMKQAVSEAKKRQDGIPCVFHRIDRKDWLVTMKRSDYKWFSEEADINLFITEELRQRFNLYSVIEDTEKMLNSGGSERIPFIILHEELATMLLVDWIDMYGAWIEKVN